MPLFDEATLRRLDWNVFARLERPFIKLRQKEEDLAVHLWLDASGSMDWPPSDGYNKFDYARRLVGGLGHIALSANDVFNVTLIGAQPDRWGPRRGQGGIAWGCFVSWRRPIAAARPI